MREKKGQELVEGMRLRDRQPQFLQQPLEIFLDLPAMMPPKVEVG
jgi:hypothetical protein